MYPEALKGDPFEVEWEKVPGERKGQRKSWRIGEPRIKKYHQELLDLLKKHMNESVVRSYIRGLLIEQEEEQSVDDKLRDLFLDSAVHAIELGRLSPDMDPGLLEKMETARDAIHGMMRLSLQTEWSEFGYMPANERWRSFHNAVKDIYPDPPERGTHNAIKLGSLKRMASEMRPVAADSIRSGEDATRSAYTAAEAWAGPLPQDGGRN